MATQEGAIQAVQDVVGAITGIKGAPDYPPEQLGAFPFVVAYPGDGEHMINTPGERKFLGQIVVEVHVGRKNLPLDTEAVIGYGDSVPNALFRALTNTSSPTAAQTALQAAVSTFGNISQTFGELGWGDTPTIGFRFVMNDVKLLTALT